ncbi:hypothetical protein N2152v2_001608 [Parachlorella kessleri]
MLSVSRTGLTKLYLVAKDGAIRDALPSLCLFPNLAELDLELDEEYGNSEELDFLDLPPLPAVQRLGCMNWGLLEAGGSVALPQLTQLQLTCTELIHIDAALPSLKELEVLAAGTCLLYGEGLRLPQLTALSLQHVLSTIDVDWLALPELASLKFEHDSDVRINTAKLRALTRLTALDLGYGDRELALDPADLVLHAVTTSLRSLDELRFKKQLTSPPYHDDVKVLTELWLIAEAQTIFDALPLFSLFPNLKSVELQLGEDYSEERELDFLDFPALPSLEELTCANWGNVVLTGPVALPHLTQLGFRCSRAVEIDAALPSLQKLEALVVDTFQLCGEHLSLPQLTALTLQDLTTGLLNWAAMPQLASLTAEDFGGMHINTAGISALSHLTQLHVCYGGPLDSELAEDPADLRLQAAPSSELRCGRQLISPPYRDDVKGHVACVGAVLLLIATLIFPNY